MNSQVYQLNDTHNANFETNQIMVKEENNADSMIKVEPRIMEVLKILVLNSPNVVSRELLIQEVWNNYGGADDALNQAISQLRKILSDKDKDNRIIETVVKKGYRFNRAIEQLDMGNIEVAKYKDQNRMLLILILIMITTILLYIIIDKNEENSSAPPAPAPEHVDVPNDTNTHGFKYDTLQPVPERIDSTLIDQRVIE